MTTRLAEVPELAAAAAARSNGTPSVALQTTAPYVNRLRPVVSPHEQSTAVHAVAPAAEARGETEDDAVVASTPSLEDSASVAALDEAAESAFLAEARDRGEVVTPKRSSDDVDESAKKTLPPLEELVNRIPPEVRDTLEELFRARFVTVKRFPKKALKSEQQEKRSTSEM